MANGGGGGGGSCGDSICSCWWWWGGCVDSPTDGTADSKLAYTLVVVLVVILVGNESVVVGVAEVLDDGCGLTQGLFIDLLGEASSR